MDLCPPSGSDDPPHFEGDAFSVLETRPRVRPTDLDESESTLRCLRPEVPMMKTAKLTCWNRSISDLD
jgi:hypothetical protein